MNPSISVNAYEEPSLDEFLSNAVNMQLDAIIGMNILRNADSLTIDYPRCRAWVEWSNGD